MKLRFLIIFALALVGAKSSYAGDGQYVPTLLKYEDGRVLIFMTDTRTGITKLVFAHKPLDVSDKITPDRLYDKLLTPFDDLKNDNNEALDFFLNLQGKTKK